MKDRLSDLIFFLDNG